jgi:hypothetical protein
VAYYVVGLLLAALIFQGEALWRKNVSEHGPAAVAGVFAFMAIWPVMLVIMAALSFRKAQRSLREVHSCQH